MTRTICYRTAPRLANTGGPEWEKDGEGIDPILGALAFIESRAGLFAQFSEPPQSEVERLLTISQVVLHHATLTNAAADIEPALSSLVKKLWSARESSSQADLLADLAKEAKEVAWQLRRTHSRTNAG